MGTPWKNKWKNKYCGISKGRLRPGKDKNGLGYSIFLECSHGFYRSVLTEWVKKCPKSKPTCPICRKEFSSDIVFKK
jgi:hypothetical protein